MRLSDECVRKPRTDERNIVHAVVASHQHANKLRVCRTRSRMSVESAFAWLCQWTQVRHTNHKVVTQQGAALGSYLDSEELIPVSLLRFSWCCLVEGPVMEITGA